MIKIGIGPSSSHTMGPWIAAELFLEYLSESNIAYTQIKEIQINLYGSLAKTGKGHGTDIALLMGLSGEDYRSIDTSSIPSKVEAIITSKVLNLDRDYPIHFDYNHHFIFHKNETKSHPNTLLLKAILHDGSTAEKQYYSLGGGFVATDETNSIENNAIRTPYPCHIAKSILDFCTEFKLSVSELIYINEQAWRSKEEIRIKALSLWYEMKQSIWRGCHAGGLLPGGIKVKRRAGEINNHHLLKGLPYNNIDEWLNVIKSMGQEFTLVNKWITCFALAVNEENASFGRIVTAPTNGAAGVIPAVLMYAHCFLSFDDDKIIRFILTAGEIGTLFKKNATISAAVGGCQAEIGVSSAMAAAGLAEGMGATPAQVLMAAEIAMEHHLGLTCDPVGGLVQIPCIERNSMGAIKAITAANLAIESDPATAQVSLDDVIKTMWETAQDMNSRYKETSEGGLATIAVNVVEC